MQAPCVLGLTLVILLLGPIKRVPVQAVQLPLVLDIRHEKLPEAEPEVQRRADSGPILETVDNDLFWYYANITIGTPGQVVRLRINPGAPHTFVNTASSAYCMQSSRPCLATGTYEANSSSTYMYLSNDYFDDFGSNLSVSGDWATDTIAIGNATANGVRFGIAYDSNYPFSGTLGLGYADNTTGDINPSLPQTLFDEDLIACVAFSLWLDDVESPHGQVIFGGVDTGKLVGALETIPMFAETNEYPTLSVGISKVQLSYNGVSYTLIDAEIQAFLDTGVPDMYLPQNVADLIYSLLGATFDGDPLHPLVPCSWKDNTTTIDFTLGSFLISVPINEFIFPAGTSSSTNCPLFISRTNGTNSLGVAFLRNVVAVYDYSHSQVSLAKANFESTTTNIIAIGPNGVGDLTGTASNNSNTTTTSASGKPARSNSGLSTGAKAGISVSAALGGLLLLGALVFIWRKRHQKRVTTALLDTSPAPPVSQKASELPPQELPPEGLPPNELSSDDVPATAGGA